jgi:hypothetical protein
MVMLKRGWITLWITLWVNMRVTAPSCLLSQFGPGPWRPERKEAAAGSSFLFHVKLFGLRGVMTFLPLSGGKNAPNLTITANRR